MSGGDWYVRDQEELYKKEGDPWANLEKDRPRYNLYQQYHKIISSMILPRYKTVADIGCGVGGLVNVINTKTHATAVGVDSSETAIKKAKETFPKWDFFVGDVRYWKPQNLIDMVMITGPYHHLTSEEKISTLSNIKTYLNPGGAILVAYGGIETIDGDKMDYPDLGHEIFSIFKKQQYISYMYKDNERNQNGSWKFYVGEKEV